MGAPQIKKEKTRNARDEKKQERRHVHRLVARASGRDRTGFAAHSASRRNQGLAGCAAESHHLMVSRNQVPLRGMYNTSL
jgi:hypothetical protein